MSGQFMSQAAFAELCGVSAMAISKHKASGFIVLRGGKVDAMASLGALEGHLDERKRRAALARLKELSKNDVAEPPPPAALAAVNDAAAPQQSWVAEKNRADALLRQIDLAERQGQLLDAAEVRAAVEDVIATFWSELGRRERLDADEIASALKLGADDAKELRRLLAARTHRLRKDFAEAMSAMAAAVAPQQMEVA